RARLSSAIRVFQSTILRVAAAVAEAGGGVARDVWMGSDGLMKTAVPLLTAGMVCAVAVADDNNDNDDAAAAATAAAAADGDDDDDDDDDDEDDGDDAWSAVVVDMEVATANGVASTVTGTDVCVYIGNEAATVTAADVAATGTAEAVKATGLAAVAAVPSFEI